MEREYWISRLGTLLEGVPPRADPQVAGKEAANDPGQASARGGETAECAEAPTVQRREEEEEGNERSGFTEVCRRCQEEGASSGRNDVVADGGAKLGDAEGSTGTGSQASCPKTVVITGCETSSALGSSAVEKTVTEVVSLAQDRSQALVPAGCYDLSSATRRGFVEGTESRSYHRVRPPGESSCRSEESENHELKEGAQASWGHIAFQRARSTPAATCSTGNDRQASALDFPGPSSRQTNSNEVDHTVLSSERWPLDSLGKVGGRAKEGKTPVGVDRSVQTDPTFQDLVLGLQSKGSLYTDVPPVNPLAILSSKAETNTDPCLHLDDKSIESPSRKQSISFDISSPMKDGNSCKRCLDDADSGPPVLQSREPQFPASGKDKPRQDGAPKKKRVRFENIGVDETMNDLGKGVSPGSHLSVDRNGAFGVPLRRDPRLRHLRVRNHQDGSSSKVVKSILKSSSTAGAQKNCVAMSEGVHKPFVGGVPNYGHNVSEEQLSEAGAWSWTVLDKRGQCGVELETGCGMDSLHNDDNDEGFEWGGGDLGDEDCLEHPMSSVGPTSDENYNIAASCDHAEPSNAACNGLSTRENHVDGDCLAAGNHALLERLRSSAGDHAVLGSMHSQMDDPMEGSRGDDAIVAEAMKVVVGGIVEDCAGGELYDVFDPSGDLDFVDGSNESDADDVLGDILSQGYKACGLLEGLYAGGLSHLPSLGHGGSAKESESSPIGSVSGAGQKKCSSQNGLLKCMQTNGMIHSQQTVEANKEELERLEAESLEELECLARRRSYTPRKFCLSQTLPDSDGEDDTNCQSPVSEKGLQSGKAADDKGSQKKEVLPMDFRSTKKAKKILAVPIRRKRVKQAKRKGLATKRRKKNRGPH